MQYLYHQRQRPADNSIAYWRKFVSEYYSPRAKKRWCLSLYDNVGHHTLWVFPQDAWQCDICGSKSGRGFGHFRLLLVPLTLVLTIFVFWHVYLILQNKTTIEYHEGVRAMWLAEKGGYLYSHPYDLDAYENMISVLGPNIFCWVYPTSEQIGSDLRFHAGVDKLAGISF